MTYPTLEQYQEALQHPANVLLDSELRQGTVRTTGLGMPLALCGGFALTYTVTAGGKKYAVRCFHKESKALEARYKAISNRLKGLNSPYFLDFTFRSDGVRINKGVYPLVKMAWASGETLGEFLETNYRNKAALTKLRQALLSLAVYLDHQHIAHGDIQTGNVMVGDSGARVQLIDYDGMYVDELRPLGSAEMGHRNFQHPERASKNPYDAALDRFSLIALTMALRVLEERPELWSKTRSDIDGIIFRAGDYFAPESSFIFNELSQSPSLGIDAKNFAAICKAAYRDVPTLSDFVAQKNIPATAFVLSGVAAGIKQRAYFAPYSVLDGTRFDECLGHVGDRVELIGRIVEVKEGWTRGSRKPYVFLNFSPWKGKAVKISIWTEGLHALQQKPDQSWVGKWISVVGLMEPLYRNSQYNYEHLAITVSQKNELTLIDQTEAEFRLAGSRVAPATRSAIQDNRDVLTKITGGSSTAKTFPPTHATTSLQSAPARTTSKSQSTHAVNSVPPAPPQTTPNQAILVKIKGGNSTGSTPASPQSYSPLSGKNGSGLPNPAGSRQPHNPPSQNPPPKSFVEKLFNFFFK